MWIAAGFEVRERSSRRWSLEPIAPKLILVPTDFSAPSAQALRYGAALAERFSAHLLVIYADPFAVPVDLTISAAGVFDVPREEFVEVAREELQAFAEANVPRTVPYDLRVLIGMPVDAIVTQAKETGADLIVMGTHGRTGLRRLLVGSVSEAVTRLAPVPVIVVPESWKETCNEPADPRWIIGCVTPARECRAALRYATALANPAARFVLFGAAASAGRPFTMDDLNLLEVCTPGELAGRTSFKAIDSLKPEDVVEAAQAERADLLVLGIAGDRSFADTLRGTTAERVVQQSACPVLTVNRFAAVRMAEEIHEHEPALSA
jgi:nucleotide-binding universal stress UspA family protein